MTPWDRLTVPQKEVVWLAFRYHMTDREIAEHLGVSEEAVAARWRLAFDRLGVNRRREAYVACGLMQMPRREDVA